MEKRKVLGQCQICGADRAYTQYGAIACRACGTFFRRLSLLRRNYPCTCRHVEEISLICGMERILRCKGCRQQKCMAMGMTDQRLRSLPLKDFHRQRQLFFLATTKAEAAEEENDIPTEAIEEEEKMPTSSTPQQLDSDGFNSQMQLVCREISDQLVLDDLRQLEARIRRMHFSVTGFDWSYLECFDTIEELVNCQDNLMARWQQFSLVEMPIYSGIKEKIQREGIYYQETRVFSRHIRLALDFAKTLPVFSQLGHQDKMSLLCNFGIVAAFFLLSFYSLAQGSETMLMPGKVAPADLFSVQRFAHDKILQKLVDLVYNRPVQRLANVAPDREEFMLIMALIFLNGTTSTISTPAGQQLLAQEVDKYGRLLVRIQQRNLGEQAGAARYAETLQLMWGAIQDAHKYREMVVYIGCMHQHSCFGNNKKRRVLDILNEGQPPLTP